MPELKAFIFDLDGVIANTVGLHYEAWKRLFDDLEIPFVPSDMDRFRGVHQREILRVMAGNLSEAQMIRCLARKDIFYKQLLKDAGATILNQPIAALLYEAKARGLKIGLASSSTNARYVLNIVRLHDLFDAIADGHTVPRSKPAPDIFVWVAGALGLHPGEIVVIEDGSAGVQAALTAGMYVVGVNLSNRTYAPDLNLSMEDVRFETIGAQFQERVTLGSA